MHDFRAQAFKVFFMVYRSHWFMPDTWILHVQDIGCSSHACSWSDLEGYIYLFDVCKLFVRYSVTVVGLPALLHSLSTLAVATPIVSIIYRVMYCRLGTGKLKSAVRSVVRIYRQAFWLADGVAKYGSPSRYCLLFGYLGTAWETKRHAELSIALLWTLDKYYSKCVPNSIVPDVGCYGQGLGTPRRYPINSQWFINSLTNHPTNCTVKRLQ